MADGLHIAANTAEIIGRMRKAPAAVQAEVVAGVARALLLTESAVRSSRGVRWRRGAAGLAGRLTSFARSSSAFGVDAAIGFRRTRGFPYELAQEFGAKARSGGAMAVPVSGEARALSARGKSARDFPRPLWLLRRGGRAVLLETVAPGEIEPHYVLLKSLRPRLGFRQTVQANTSLIDREVAASWRRGWAKT
jgi:hypothetical protein